MSGVSTGRSAATMVPVFRRRRIVDRRTRSGGVAPFGNLGSATEAGEDLLAPAQGILVGLAGALICWLLIGLAIWALLTVG